MCAAGENFGNHSDYYFKFDLIWPIKTVCWRKLEVKIMKKTFNLAPDFDQKVQKRQKTATLIFDFKNTKTPLLTTFYHLGPPTLRLVWRKISLEVFDWRAWKSPVFISNFLMRLSPGIIAFKGRLSKRHFSISEIIKVHKFVLYISKLFGS